MFFLPRSFSLPSFLIFLNFLVIFAYSKKTNGHCPKDWKNVTRPSGEWCMKIIYENYLIHSEAEKRCQEEGATLSGFQNQMESMWVTTTVASKIYPNTGSVWVGYRRIKDCLKSGVTANCTRLNSFEWTDKVTTGSHGVVWTCGQPSNYAYAQECVTLTVGYTGYTEDGYQVGTLDDAYCGTRFKGTPRDVRAIVCGKTPEC
ncbi:hypothetical protein CAEBREN_21895 [Caenorhabditis brenneri]|uniref:C-type lectin domain-containing protein n=1 Tax=Caenorhabditis brenneri TaxID=135651 RepID=G0PAE0_CAEBE|nr:hypothetical protein CAEBREN_21895 [Caenorhabditis brenneri]